MQSNRCCISKQNKQIIIWVMIIPSKPQRENPCLPLFSASQKEDSLQLCQHVDLCQIQEQWSTFYSSLKQLFLNNKNCYLTEMYNKFYITSQYFLLGSLVYLLLYNHLYFRMASSRTTWQSQIPDITLNEIDV